jgi:hypothetical protein
MVTTNFCTLSLTGKSKGKIHLERPGWGWVVNAMLWSIYPQGKDPGTHCTGGWVDPRVSLDGCRKSCIHRDSILNHQACSESLYYDVHWLMTLPFQKGINAARSDVPTAVLMKFKSTAVSHHVHFR